MSVSKEYLQYVLDLVSSVGDVRTRRMFGGVLLKVGDKQLGILIDETMYFKVVDPEQQEQYKNKGSVQFTYTRKDKKNPVVIKNWWSVPDDAMDNREEMVRLAEEVLRQIQ